MYHKRRNRGKVFRGKKRFKRRRGHGPSIRRYGSSRGGIRL